jgi:putative SOS response-associated peptidase YedK
VAKEETEDKSTCEILIEAMQWGLYRPGSTDLVINGRFEELVDKPMFRGLLETKRCVVCIQSVKLFNPYI